MATAQSKYIPGVCNIGPTEIASRRRTAYISLAVAVVLAIIFFIPAIPHLVRIIVFLPLFAAASAAIQVRSHFCAGFGMTGLFNFSDELGKTETAQQAEWRAKDKRRALAITGQAALIAAVITAVLVLI